MQNKARVAVVIPLYQPPLRWEQSCLEHIIALIKTYPQYNFTFVIVSDGTPKKELNPLTKKLMSLHIPHSLYFLTKNHGKGKALKVGVEKTSADYYICIDWDFPFGIFVVGDILDKLHTGTPVVVIDRGENYTANLPWFRAWLTTAWRYIVKQFLNLPIRDTQGGTRGFRAEVVPLFVQCRLNRFLHTLEFIVVCLQNNVRVEEVQARLKPGIRFTDFSLKVYLQELKGLISLLPDIWSYASHTQQLIINADDLGMCTEINKGIFTGIRKGVITSVSVMTTTSAYFQAIKTLRRYPSIAVGLHFSLTEGTSLTHSFDPRFTNSQGMFTSFRSLLLAWIIQPRKFMHALRTELAAQYKMLASSGFPITHLDSHQHIHAFPAFYELFVTFAQEKRILRVRSLPFSLLFWITYLFSLPTFKELLIVIMYNLNSFLQPQAVSAAVRKSGGATFIYDLNWHKDMNERHWHSFLSFAPRNSIELICHVASPTKKFSSVMVRERENTLQFLLNKKNLALMTAAGYIIMTLGNT